MVKMTLWKRPNLRQGAHNVEMQGEKSILKEFERNEIDKRSLRHVPNPRLQGSRLAGVAATAERDQPSPYSNELRSHSLRNWLSI